MQQSCLMIPNPIKYQCNTTCLPLLSSILSPSTFQRNWIGFCNAWCKLAAVMGNMIFGTLVGITKAIPILLASSVLVGEDWWDCDYLTPGQMSSCNPCVGGLEKLKRLYLTLIPHCCTYIMFITNTSQLGLIIF